MAKVFIPGGAVLPYLMSQNDSRYIVVGGTTLTGLDLDAVAEVIRAVPVAGFVRASERK